MSTWSTGWAWLNYNINNINILATKRRANMTLNNRAIVFIMLVKTIVVFKKIFPINYLIAVAVLHNMNVSSIPLKHLITVANTWKWVLAVLMPPVFSKLVFYKTAQLWNNDEAVVPQKDRWSSPLLLSGSDPLSHIAMTTMFLFFLLLPIFPACS